MTSSSIKLDSPARDPQPKGAVDPSSMRRSLLGQALYDTFGQKGARIGAIWITLLAAAGVFAPFVASSFPILYRVKGGRLESPMLAYLSPLDVILILVFTHTVFVLTRKPGAGMVLALSAWPVAFVGWVAAMAYILPRLLTLSIYRPSGATVTAFGWLTVGLLHLLIGLIALIISWMLYRGSAALFRGLRDQPTAFWLSISAVAAAALGISAVFLVRPPENTIYERYREAEKAGQVELAVRTVIPYSPNDRLRDHPDEAIRPPDRKHWLGTTQYGEDMSSRMIHATRVALAIGLIATSISTLIGVIIGGLMGYYGGTLDLIGMRCLEIIEAIPTLILLLIVTVSFGRSLYLMMVVIGLLTWTSDARFIRAEFFRLRNLDFVHAAVAAGLGRASIIFRHMLPNGVAPVLVNASFGIAGAILLESTLSFLGLGLGPDDPSWGQLLEQARSGAGFNWWIATFPGLAIFLTVFSYILIGESMRDAIDPKLKKAH